MHHQLFEGGGETLRAIVPDVGKQDLAADRAWIRFIPHPRQVDPVIIVREKHHGLAVSDAGKEHPLLLWNELTELFRQRRLDVGLIRDNLLLDQEIDELIQPVMRHLVERGGIGGRFQQSAALVILIGYLLVHLTQHTLAPHFHFGEEVHHVSKMVSFSALAGLMLHTFVDGVAIASGFGVSHALGMLVFIAILLHKLPEGLAISSLFSPPEKAAAPRWPRAPR